MTTFSDENNYLTVRDIEQMHETVEASWRDLQKADYQTARTIQQFKEQCEKLAQQIAELEKQKIQLDRTSSNEIANAEYVRTNARKSYEKANSNFLDMTKTYDMPKSKM